MGYNLTEDFRALARKAAEQSGDGRSHVKSSILRPVRRPNEFAKAASEVSRQIQESKDFVESHKRTFITPGMIDDAERDRIELEMVSFIKACSTSVEHLSVTVTAIKEQQSQKLTSSMEQLSQQAIAHRHGMVLILSEKLKELTSMLDGYRTEYARQSRMLQDRRKRQQEKQKAKISHLSSPADIPQVSRSNGEASSPLGHQQLIQEESQALFEELTHLSDRVHSTEKMMHEISTLNQMLSAQIMGQTEQIEQIYSDAIQSSFNMKTGNKHLKSAIDYNRSTRRYLLILLIAAGLILLFFDRFYS